MKFGIGLPGIPGARVYLEADPGGGGGGRDPEPPRKPNPADLLGQYNGDAVRMASKLADLEGDNYKLREKNRDLSSQLEATKAKVPGDGAVVLGREDAQAYEEFKKLNLKPADVQAAITERDDFKAKFEQAQGANAALQREGLLRDVAAVTGYKFTVLADRDRLTPGLDYELRDVDENGQKVKRAFVKYRDGEGESAPVKEQLLSEFATAKWSDYLPALSAQAAGEPAGGRHVPQGSGGAPGGAGASIFDKIRQEAAERAKGQEKPPSVFATPGQTA
jgi:hypothetical protein